MALSRRSSKRKSRKSRRSRKLSKSEKKTIGLSVGLAPFGGLSLLGLTALAGKTRKRRAANKASRRRSYRRRR